MVKSRQENLIQIKPLDTPNLPPADVAWLLLLLKNISTWKADTVTTWLNNCINLSVHADSACNVRLTWCRFSLLFSSLSWLLLNFAIDLFYLTIAGWVRYSEFSWQLNQELTIELNSALLHNWSKFDIPYKHWPKFDKWHSWTYFYWTWFDSLNHIRDLASPNLFIKTSIILIRELKNLNLIIKSLMILIRDFNFPNLIHWTCLNWT